MAETKISDIIIPEVFLPYMIQRTAERSQLINSGIIQADAQFDTIASGGGTIVQMPFWKDLTGLSEILSDNGALTVNKITTARDKARIHQRGKAWGANDLTGMLAGDDPMAAIATMVADWRARDMQQMLLSTLSGVFAAASMSTNLLALHALTGTPTSANFLTATTFIDATQLMGDSKDKLTAILMHSAVESHLRKLDLIDFVRPSAQGEAISVFQGKRVIIDDGVPTTVVDTKTVYATYLFGQGAIALGNSSENPTLDGGFGTWQLEYGRVGLAGENWLANRFRNILHPRGIAWQEVAIDGVSPTNAELEEGQQWIRAYESKNVRIVKVTHNIAA